MVEHDLAITYIGQVSVPGQKRPKGPRQSPKQVKQRIAHDPNALIGPAGYGTQGFIQPTGAWPYTVDFENDGSVAAQDVTVTEQLDPNLDWSTFQLGSFGFGPVNVTIPAGLTQYQTTVAYQNSDGSSLNVQVALDFNVQTGLLTVTFTSLDPLTGQAPTGVFDGFLPPDNSSGIGEGYVQYTVQPKAGLTTGTTINQQASVVFDINAAIMTNAAVNTIDTAVPTSSRSRPARHRELDELHRELVGERWRRLGHPVLQRLCVRRRRPVQQPHDEHHSDLDDLYRPAGPHL